MNVKDLKRGKRYRCSLAAGEYGQTIATYLGSNQIGGQTLYNFYDGETNCISMATAVQTLTGKMSIMHFTEKNVADHIKEIVNSVTHD